MVSEVDERLVDHRFICLKAPHHSLNKSKARVQHFDRPFRQTIHILKDDVTRSFILQHCWKQDFSITRSLRIGRGRKSCQATMFNGGNRWPGNLCWTGRWWTGDTKRYQSKNRFILLQGQRVQHPGQTPTRSGKHPLRPSHWYQSGTQFPDESILRTASPTRLSAPPPPSRAACSRTCRTYVCNMHCIDILYIDIWWYDGMTVWCCSNQTGKSEQTWVGLHKMVIEET